MRRNNKVLYEQIMRNVSREVKKALNEAKNEKIILSFTPDEMENVISEISSNMRYAQQNEDSESMDTAVADILKALKVPEKYTLKYTIEIEDYDEDVLFNYMAYLHNQYIGDDRIEINSGYDDYDGNTHLLTYAEWDDYEPGFKFYYTPTNDEDMDLDEDELYLTIHDFENGEQIINNYVISNFPNVTQETLHNIWDAISNRIEE